MSEGYGQIGNSPESNLKDSYSYEYPWLKLNHLLLSKGSCFFEVVLHYLKLNGTTAATIKQLKFIIKYLFTI